MDSTCTPKEVKSEFLPFYKVYKDGTVERLQGTPYVPPRLDDPITGVSSKDIIISQNPLIQARIHLPKRNPANSSPQKLPVLLYFHGGAFCIESAFSQVEHQFMTSLAAEAHCLAISVEYRLAPEHPLPAAYDDCWYALQWVGSHALAPEEAREPGFKPEPWVSDHADFDRIFIGGDSAGANLAHNTVMRAATEELPGRVKILGSLITHPFFMGTNVIGPKELAILNKLYPSAALDVTNPLMNPIFAAKGSNLAKMPCKRLLVVVSEEDFMVDRGRLYYRAVKESGWEGESELIEVEGEGHGFHIVNYEKDSAKAMIKRLATYLTTT